jgi:uncharacterized protein
MKKTTISRRDFMVGLTTGALSAAIIPSLIPDLSGIREGNIASLPPFFDCNKYFGPGFPEHPDFPGATDLLSHMNRLGIDRVVAWHTAARENHPMAGNEQMLRELEATDTADRIVPSFIITRSIIDEHGEMERLLDLVKKHNIKAFHFFPEKSGSSLNDIAPLIRTILPFNPVLFLDSFENLGDDIESLLKFSADFPRVNIIFTNAMWGHLGKLYKLMEARPNILVDTSLLHVYKANEYIIRKFGAERLIFGTGYKSNNGASIAALAHAEITPEHARMIAHGNLERLLAIKKPLSGTRPVVGDRLWHRLLRQEPLGTDIIDAHTHLCRTIAIWDDHDQTDIDSHAKLALSSMDNMGVRSMIIAEYTIHDPDLSSGKTWMEDQLNPYGDRFRGYFSGLAFRSADAEKMVSRMDEIFSRPYYAGFKMHNNHWTIPVTDPCFVPVWKYADTHRLPILLHTWNDIYDAPKMLNDIVPHYPNAIFLLGHSGNVDRTDAEKLAQENPNVYLEWCGSFLNTSDWRETLERLGNRRIVYGSDFISWESKWGHDPAWEMGRLLSLDVPDETLLPILGGNMRSILSRRR